MALRIEPHTNPLWKFEVYWKRLLLLVASTGLVAYFAAATALWVFLQRNPDNQVRWRDVATMPFDREGFQRKRGDTAILTGIRQFRERDYTEAFYNLRAGLGRAPGNVEGRLLLARQIVTADSPRAISLLEDGIAPTGANLDLLGALFRYYTIFQTRTKALQKSEELLAATGSQALSADRRTFVAGARAALLIELERAPEAVQQLAAINPRPADRMVDHRLRFLETEALLRAGRALDARRSLEQITLAGPPADDTLYLQAEIAISLEDVPALQSALLKMKARSPGSAGPLLYAFRAWYRLKRPTLRDAVEQEIYSVFGANDAALQGFAALLVNLDLPEIIAHVQSVAEASRLSPFAFQVHLTEVALRRGDFEHATRLLRGWENKVVTLNGTQRFYPEFLKLLTRAAFTGSEQPVTALVGHLAGSRGQTQLPVCLLAVSVLDRAGNLSAEEQVLRVALSRFPYSDPLLIAQKKLQTQLAAGTAAKAVADASLAAGSASVLPTTAAAALKQIDALLKADALIEARDLLRAIRSARPPWLAPQEAEFGLREIQLAFASQDLLSTRNQLRQYLDRFHTETDGLNLVRIASGLVSEKNFAAARVLHDELLTKFGGNIRIFTALRELKLPDDLVGSTKDAASTLRALDEWLDTRQLAQAERMLDYLRDKPPLWLLSVKHEVRVREVRLHLAADEQPQALVIYREVVLQPGASRSAAFRLVRESVARGEHTHAVALATEIVKLLPDDQAAAKLLKEVQTPAPDAP